MTLRSLLFWVGLVGLHLAMISCQGPGSLQLVWSVRRGLVGQWGVRGEEVFVVGQHLEVYSLADGRELRRVRLPKDYGRTTFGEISPEVAISDTSLVFAWYDFKDKEAKIYCYDPKTLALRWERGFHWPWDAPIAPTFSVVVDKIHLYAVAIGKEGQNLFKLRLADGRTEWSVTIDRFVRGVPVVLYDGKLLVRSTVSPWSEDAYGYFQAIDPENGKILWRVRIDGKSGHKDDQPLISLDHAYLTSEAPSPDGVHFYTVDLRRGKIVNHQLVHRLRMPFAENQGILYFGSSRPAAFDLQRKQVVWQAHLHGPKGLGPPVNATGLLDPIREEIYLGDWERDLYVLSARSGEVKDKVYIRGFWRGEIFSPVKAFFASYGVRRLEFVQGFLFVGTVDSSLFVFRPTGQQ